MWEVYFQRVSFPLGFSHQKTSQVRAIYLKYVMLSSETEYVFTESPAHSVGR